MPAAHGSTTAQRGPRGLGAGLGLCLLMKPDGSGARFDRYVAGAVKHVAVIAAQRDHGGCAAVTVAVHGRGACGIVTCAWDSTVTATTAPRLLMIIRKTTETALLTTQNTTGQRNASAHGRADPTAARLRAKGAEVARNVSDDGWGS